MSRIVVIGSMNMDMVIYVRHMPATGETIISDDVYFNPGGKGANQAYALAKLGGDVSFVGAIGLDDNGRQLKDNLKSVGADVSHVFEKNGFFTGSAIIMVNEQGDNSIVVVPGANNAIGIDDIEAIRDIILECDILVLQLEIPVQAVIMAAKIAKEYGKMVILDPAPVPDLFPMELLQYVDIIKPNETELFMLAGGEASDLSSAIKKLKSFGVKDVIVTLGSAGVLVDSLVCGQFQVEGIPVKAVDTTAAGDSFTAAMAIRLAEGESLKNAVNYANFVGSIVVTRKGAQSSIPGKEELEHIYN